MNETHLKVSKYTYKIYLVIHKLFSRLKKEMNEYNYFIKINTTFKIK